MYHLNDCIINAIRIHSFFEPHSHCNASFGKPAIQGDDFIATN